MSFATNNLGKLEKFTHQILCLQGERLQKKSSWCKDPPPSPTRQGEAAVTLGGIPTWSFFQRVYPWKVTVSPKRTGSSQIPSFFRGELLNFGDVIEKIQLQWWINHQQCINQPLWRPFNWLWTRQKIEKKHTLKTQFLFKPMGSMYGIVWYIYLR